MSELRLGFAQTCVTVIVPPSGSVDTNVVVNSGGAVEVTCPAGSVVGMNIVDEAVVLEGQERKIKINDLKNV